MSLEVGNHVMDDLPDYVLDLLTDAEADHVAKHLSDCQSCRLEYMRLQAIADDLPLALPQTAPPGRVKHNLMNAIRAGKTGAETSPPPSFWQNLAGTFRQRLPAWSVALILVLALGNLLLWQQYRPSSSQSGTPMLVIPLVNTSAAPLASGTLIMDQHGHYGTLVVDQLPAIDADQQYQVWLNRPGERLSAGLLTVNYEGYGSLELSAPQPLLEYDSLGITLEPYGGSPGPTGDKVLGGDIPH
jgi:anti-sigma-K factor RskA